MSLRNVLQINVRLSEGGAAGVARTLADELGGRGVKSPIAYGYGRGGRASPLEGAYENVRVTPGLAAAANRIGYSLIGRDTRIRSSRRWTNFLQAVNASDVVHLHAIHSHIVDSDLLFNALAEAGKPVVWTLHDQWAMTGRCAQPGSCRLWEQGCPKCPDLAAYPPAKIDNAAKRWVERRAMIEKLQTSVPTAVVACANWLAEEAKRASIKQVTVVRNSVDRAFWQATLAAPPRAIERDGIRNLFMCRDLRDKQKVNWSILRKIASLPHQSLTIVGDYAPHTIDGTECLPAIADRAQLANVLQQHDRLVFTSRVDYFPLTIAEALTAGLEVCALDSPAAREFSGHSKLSIFENEEALLAHLEDQTRSKPGSLDFTPEERSYFDPRRMTDDYISIYSSLLKG